MSSRAIAFHSLFFFLAQEAAAEEKRERETPSALKKNETKGKACSLAPRAPFLRRELSNVSSALQSVAGGKSGQGKTIPSPHQQSSRRLLYEFFFPLRGHSGKSSPRFDAPGVSLSSWFLRFSITKSSTWSHAMKEGSIRTRTAERDAKITIGKKTQGFSFGYAFVFSISHPQPSSAFPPLPHFLPPLSHRKLRYRIVARVSKNGGLESDQGSKSNRRLSSTFFSPFSRKKKTSSDPFCFFPFPPPLILEGNCSEKTSLIPTKWRTTRCSCPRPRGRCCR